MTSEANLIIDLHSAPGVGGNCNGRLSHANRCTQVDALLEDSSSHRNLHQFPLSDPVSPTWPHLAPSQSHTYQIKRPPSPSSSTLHHTPLHPGRQNLQVLFPGIEAILLQKNPLMKDASLDFHSHLSWSLLDYVTQKCLINSLKVSMFYSILTFSFPPTSNFNHCYQLLAHLLLYNLKKRPPGCVKGKG